MIFLSVGPPPAYDAVCICFVCISLMSLRSVYFPKRVKARVPLCVYLPSAVWGYMLPGLQIHYVNTSSSGFGTSAEAVWMDVAESYAGLLAPLTEASY